MRLAQYEPVLRLKPHAILGEYSNTRALCLHARFAVKTATRPKRSSCKSSGFGPLWTRVHSLAFRR